MFTERACDRRETGPCWRPGSRRGHAVSHGGHESDGDGIARDFLICGLGTGSDLCLTFIALNPLRNPVARKCNGDLTPTYKDHVDLPDILRRPRPQEPATEEGQGPLAGMFLPRRRKCPSPSLPKSFLAHCIRRQAASTCKTANIAACPNRWKPCSRADAVGILYFSVLRCLYKATRLPTARPISRYLQLPMRSFFVSGSENTSLRAGQCTTLGPLALK